MVIRQGGGICPRRDSTNARAGRVHAARARSRDATNGSGEVNDLQGLGRLRFFYDIPGEDTGRLGLGGRGKARGSSRPTSRVTTRGGGLRRHRATGRARWDRVSGCGPARTGSRFFRPDHHHRRDGLLSSRPDSRGDAASTREGGPRTVRGDEVGQCARSPFAGKVRHHRKEPDTQHARFTRGGAREPRGGAGDLASRSRSSPR